MTEADIISFREVTKRYPGVIALNRVSFSIRAGEVHAVVGENGAGKSTLMGLLGGDIQPDGGAVVVRGHPQHIKSPHVAQQLGIGMVHQELYLCPKMSVAANLQVGHEPASWGGVVRRRELHERARQVLQAVGLAVDVRTLVGRLTVAQRQLIVIARALTRDASIVVFDEPNSALNEEESERLFAIIRRLRAAGTTILYVSHRIEEVFGIADRVTVLRDGCYVDTRNIIDVTPDTIIHLMVGRDVGSLFRRESIMPKIHTPLLEIENLKALGLQAITLSVGRGEIVGVAGLEGSGKHQIARVLFGIQPIRHGLLRVDGKPVHLFAPSDAIRAGMAWIPADRRGEGVLAGMSVEQNISIGCLKQVSRFGFMRHRAVRSLANQYINALSIHTSGPGQKTGTLSGGNQQKVVLARALATSPRILVMEEPTAGIDVGAKAEIYAILRRYAADGHGILVISSELPELLGVTDRLVVMRSGRVVGDFITAGVTQEIIMACAAGVNAA